MGKHVATLSTLLIFSSNLYAGSLSVRVDGQTVTAKVCNISQGAKNVSYQIGEKGYAKNGISQPESNKENGCSIKVYANQPTSLIQKGIEVVATYTRADGSTWTQTMSASGGSSTPTLPNPPVTPRPGTPSTPTLPNPVTPRPGTPTQPPVTPRPGTPTLPEPTVPEKKTTPDAKVSGWAEDAANFMANRVVEKFGGVENFRYSFFEGFKASERSFNNLGVSITNLPEYHNERAKGQNEGTSHGFRLGGDAGARDGNSMGSQAARARFQQAVGNPAALDVASGALPSGQNFQGLQGDKTVPSFDRMLNEYNDVFLDEVKRYLRLETEFSDDVIAEIYGNYWGLSYLYGWKDYQYDTVFSSWRADNAFTLFLNKKLVREGSDRGKIEANNRMVAKYKEITNPDEYSDADDSKRRFRSAFINQYNDVIGRKWRNEVYGRINREAYTRGEYYFVLAAKEYARRTGYAQGFNPAFNMASIQGYQQSVGPAYKNSFDQTVATYSTNPIIENVRVELKNQAGQTTFSILDSIYPTVLEATNVGKVPGLVSVTLSGQSITSLPTGSDRKSVEVPGLTRVTQAAKLDTPAQLGQSAPANQATSVTLRIQVGSSVTSQTHTITVSWAQTIVQGARETNSSREAAIAQYIAAQLAQEWKRSDGLFQGDVFAKNPLSTLAGQYVQTVMALPVAEQQKLAKYNSSITAGYGRKPFLASGKWKSVEALFKQIGYKMP